MKIAILGTENSHAWGFAGLLSGRKQPNPFPELELVGVYADESTEDGRLGNEKIREVCDCQWFAKDYNEFLGHVDGIMVTARHGGNHLKYARSYIEAGLPVWVDKPITASIEDAQELVALAKANNSLLCGGSSLGLAKETLEMAEYAKTCENIVGGNVTAPVNMVNPYGDFWFYSQHLVQMVLKVFGPDIRRVTAKKQEKSVQAVYHYDNFDVTAFFGTGYTITLYSDVAKTKTASIQLGADFFVPELAEYYEMITTGKMPYSYETLVRPVYILDATIRAFTQGCTVDVCEP